MATAQSWAILKINFEQSPIAYQIIESKECLEKLLAIAFQKC